ncbi:peptide ABC transporter ATP-binding protein [candidate division KSB3 bacterium]|uniref:Peptide ABC transporter ATP-binding protein n=1 Tax=candidate division KSB3 bacterium TaxID=2044937 RepID=A0A2G6K7A8_9BACT|nr:MAG: peptide ABC transporter ATP-binding protein [candidate division KSB3 bacterium]
MKDATILELQRIGKDFKADDGQHVQALRDVSMTLVQGECVGIVGESGCGKSTLAKLICHLIKASCGKLLYHGVDVTSLHGKGLRAYYKRVQMIFQDPLSTFSPRMKMGTYLMEPFINFKLMDRRKASGYVRELLGLVGLAPETMTKYPNELSGGQLQRVVVARAIGIEPDIIICDECTSALDVSVQEQIIQLLSRLREQSGFSCIFITHDLALAENFCDRIYVMNLGEIVEIVDCENLVRDAQHPYTRMLLDSVFSVQS